MNRSSNKPRSQVARYHFTSLPRLTPRRRLLRFLLVRIARLLASLVARTAVTGLENVPDRRNLLVVTNHLGDIDPLIFLAYYPYPVEFLAKAELFDLPLLGWLLDAYGVIWVRRGEPDRRALRAAQQALLEGRPVWIAPEGRESLTGALEEGTGGAAFLALKGNFPLLPVTLTGSENANVYVNIKRLRRTQLSLTFGPVFCLDACPDRRIAIRNGTMKIMKTLARQLPPRYQGVYSCEENRDGSR